MARLERPKGYSRELWKKLQNQIRNIKRFVTQKTKTGATVKNVPDVEDVYTPKGRKRIREWSAKKQWESTEYVQRETGERLTGKEARRAWSEQRKAERERAKTTPPSATQVEAEDSIESVYNKILTELQGIPNDTLVRDPSTGKMYFEDSGGLRDTLIAMLDDIMVNDPNYLIDHQDEISNNVTVIVKASSQTDYDHAYRELLTIFNSGRVLSKQQWDDLQDTALNY